MRYYHGSVRELKVGDVLAARGDAYDADWRGADFYAALERYRPGDMLAHRDAVFMVGDPDEVDIAGGGTDWIFEVEPCGVVSRHDLNWSSYISSLIGDGYGLDSPEVAAAAGNYWNGVPHHDENVWEYLTASARIVDVGMFETFCPSPAP